MINHKRIFKLIWKTNPSVFNIKNKDVINIDYLRLGTAITPVNKMLANSEELRTILPNTLGIAPTDMGWQERVSSYLHDILINVPEKGYVMDASFTFAIDDSTKKGNIDDYKKANFIKDIPAGKSEESYILACILGEELDGKAKVSEENLYKYVNFINPSQYIEYRYCLLSAKVANHIDDINKSTNIEFYLSSDAEMKAVKDKKIKLINTASQVYTKLVSGDKSNINNVIIGGELVSDISVFNNMDFEDKCSIILELVTKEPSKLIELSNDKNLADKAKIRKYIWSNLLRVVGNTSIITDAGSPDKIIGNNITDAITFINNPENKVYVNELELKYKSLNK